MRLQILVDDMLGKELKAKANELGFSISSYARYLLKNAISRPNKIDKGLADIEAGRVEKFTLEEFKQQIAKLKN